MARRMVASVHGGGEWSSREKEIGREGKEEREGKVARPLGMPSIGHLNILLKL